MDARSDLYAFGALLYELVAGRPPFVGDDPNTIMYQHVNAEPESPVEHNESLPPGLEGLIIRLLAKPKAERPGSAEEVLAELQRATAELAGGLSTAPLRGAGAELPRIQYAKTADDVSIAYWTLGNGQPLVHTPFSAISHCLLEWQQPEIRSWYEGLKRNNMLVRYDGRGCGHVPDH